MHHLHTLFTSRFSAQYKRAYHSSERLFSNSRKPQLTAGLFNHYIENLLENGSSELDLSHFNLTPEIIRQTLPLICHPTSTFRSLKIKQLPLESISHDLIDQLANSPIETLSFDRCKINDEIARTIAHMLKYNNNLRNLVLPHNEISNTGACALAESIAINTILEELDLESNFVGKAGFNSIADALRNNNKTHIKSLNVSGNYISHQEISEFFNGLMGNQSLQTLNVSYNRPYFETSIEDETYSPLPMTETQFGKIIDYLNSNTQLNQLDISGYPLKESAVNQLAYTKHLTHLYAAHCRLGAKGFLCLLNNKRFKKLWLPENGIGYSLIHQAHMPNFKLDTLFIGDCDDKNLHHLLTAGQIDHLVIAFSYLLTDPICAFQQAQLKALDVSFGHTQGIEIQSLGKIKELQHLNLRGSFSDFKSGRVNANDFIHLSQHPTLEKLSLSMDFDEETLERIVSIPKLKALKLSHYKIPATVTKLLAKAPLLEEIELDGPIDNNSDDSGLFPLQKHPNLSKISLNYGGQRDDADLIQLVQNSRLESIQVNSSSPIKGTSPMTLIQAQLTAEEHHMRKWDPINDLETQIDQTYFP